MLSKLWKLIQYWYFRYLMTTELYMVEKWERHVAHCVLMALFLGFLYLNMTITVGLSSWAINLFTPAT